jgi:predicted negative regulator of RcsB-dependent stress response
MVEDYLSEREQAEALRDWWKENWRWIVGGVALGFALLVGYQQWNSYRDRVAVEAAKDFEQVKTALAKPDIDEATRVLGELVKKHETSPYTQEARLAIAKAHVDAGKLDEAIPLLTAVVDSAKDEELAWIARLRAARLEIAQGKFDDAVKRLDPEKAGGFAAQVREVRGDALFARKDNEGARAEYAAALAAKADAQIDRPLVELKLKEVGGTVPAPEATTSVTLPGSAP